jgi:hypothetical protein
MATVIMVPLVKANYRPIEAALRWSGLWDQEPRILTVLGDREMPESVDFPEWPSLLLNAERILDAITNKDLPCGMNFLASRPQPAIRHVDLRAWIERFYPEERPAFLFDKAPLNTSKLIGTERRSILVRAHSEMEDNDRHSLGANELSLRAETTYLNIIGAMLELTLGRTLQGQPSSVYRTQEALIAALVESNGAKLGIAQRTLERKFAEAKRRLQQS